jgi:hypothetical protein
MQNLIKHGISGALLVAAAAFLLIRPGFGFKDAAIATLQTPQTPVLPDHTGGNLAGVDV